MNFKYSVIGDNTQENREWLEKVGYKVNHSSDDRFLRTYEDGSTKISHFKNWIYEDKQPINCIGNPQLFQAVSAIREDSDYMQWFCSPLFDELELCEIDMFYAPSEYEFHKATISELQKHFK